MLLKSIVAGGGIGYRTGLRITCVSCGTTLHQYLFIVSVDGVRSDARDNNDGARAGKFARGSEGARSVSARCRKSAAAE